VRRELQRVDEDARDHEATALAGDSREREMALVQIAHGRHERYQPLPR
jgi:hypothetical protein